MNTIRSQIIALLLLISGIVLLGGGVWGFYSLLYLIGMNILLELFEHCKPKRFIGIEK